MSASNKIFDFLSKTDKNDMVVSYKGPFLDGVLAKLSEIIRESFSENIVISRKSLAVFLEMAQNVYYYSSETIIINNKSFGIGAMIVTRKGNDFEFQTGNKIPVDYVDIMTERCELVNSLDRAGLRKLKSNVRSIDAPDDSNGAGLGLIQLALTSDQKIEFEYSFIDDETAMFSLKINLKIA